MARRRPLALLLTIAALGCMVSRGVANRPGSGTPRHVAALGRECPPVPLAPGLAATIAEAGSRLVSIVAADIDADGDLDVVASDSSLQLHIWVNDGAGHFTRQRPTGSMTWRGEPTNPTVDNRPATSQVSAQSDPPSLRDNAGAGADALMPFRLAATASPDAARRATFSASTPRAPPASSTLS